MAGNPKVKCIIQGNHPHDANYTDTEHSFHLSAQIKSHEPFRVQERKITNGEFKGMTVLVIMPTTRFPFETLPLELRQTIYKLVFATDSVVSIHKYFQARGRASFPQIRTIKIASLLHVNRAIYSEAREFLWMSQHFHADSMVSANMFLDRYKRGRRHIARLTVTRSGPFVINTFCGLLPKLIRLRRVEITLPAGTRAPLRSHLDLLWNSLSLYLLANGANHQEALCLLGHIYFAVGPVQSNVLDNNGKPHRAITPELQDWCRGLVRARLNAHFAELNNKSKQMLEIVELDD